MEEWQREHITTNLPTLINFTSCSRKLLAALLSRNVLAEHEAEKIETTNTKHDKAYELYWILQTKTDGYKHLIMALHETNQTGALELLLEGFPIEQVLDSKVEFIGHVSMLRDLMSVDDLKMIYSKLKSEIEAGEYIDLVLQKSERNNPIKLINDTLPSKIPCYISRTLSKRTKIKNELFGQDCPDVFVIRGMRRHQLSELASPNRTAVSSAQIKKLTSRFILLESYDDWIEIKGTSKHPVHLVRYERDEFILEETSGGSKIISHFLDRPKEGLVNVEENEFLLISQGSNANGICICDQPGIGKSMLLANLARNVRAQYPERIVAFIPLLDIQSVRKLFKFKSVQEPLNVIKIVLSFITPSPVARELLFKLLERKSVTMELFFDGFDEIAMEDLEWTKTLLKGITQTLTNTNIYVTSRPYMRHELEGTLGVISYDILPFNKVHQVDFLVQFWKNLDSNCDASKLNQFANYCLQKYEECTKKEERDLVGFPLICRLIAHVYAKMACRYSQKDSKLTLEDACTISTSMYDIYRSYMNEAFEKVYQGQESEKSNYVSETQTDITPANLKRPLEAEKILNFHILEAIKLLFPEVAKMLYKILTVNEDDHKVLPQHFKLGILEQVYIGKCMSLKFIHRTFAEFLVADFVGGVLTNKDAYCKPSDEILVQVLFEHICCTTVEHGGFNLPQSITFSGVGKTTDLYSFRNLQVVYFLNYYLNDKEVQNVLSDDALRTFYQIAGPERLYKVLCSSAHHDCLNIFHLTKTWLHWLREKFFTPLYLGQQAMFCIFLVACNYAGAQFLEEYAKWIQEYFSFDIKTFNTFYEKKDYWTPLKIAVRRQHYELLEILVDKLNVEGEDIIEHCVKFSSDDSFDNIEKRKEMLGLLLNKSKKILEEESSILGYTPVMTSLCHVELVKYLIQQGADICDKYNDDEDSARDTEHISPDVYHHLVQLLFGDDQFERQFVRKNQSGQRLFHVGNHRQFLKSLRADTFELILDKWKIDAKAKDSFGNTVLFTGFWFNNSTLIFESLIKRGVDIHATNCRGENVLHAAALHGNLKTSKYFVSLGVDFKIQNKAGRTPMDIAVDMHQFHKARGLTTNESITKYQQLVEFYQNCSSKRD